MTGGGPDASRAATDSAGERSRRRSEPATSTITAHARALRPIRPLAEDVDPGRVGPYRGYAEVIEWLDGLAGGVGASGESGAGGVRVRAIGATVEGGPLFAVEVGPPAAPVASAVLAGLHPIEWIGVETALALIERLAADPPRDRRVIAFPLINADGYRQVEADLRAGRRRWRRSNARGVDLNRNWPTHFRAPGRVRGLRGWPAGRGDGGPYPLSEPETAAVAEALDEVARGARIEVAVSLHSIGRMLLVPYGGRWRAPAERPRLMAAARAVKARLSRRYAIKQCARWLPGAFARGIEIDHLCDHHGATALLVECSMGGFSVRDPGSWVQPFRWFNPALPGPEVADVAGALEPLVRGHDAAQE